MCTLWGPEVLGYLGWEIVNPGAQGDQGGGVRWNCLPLVPSKLSVTALTSPCQHLKFYFIVFDGSMDSLAGMNLFTDALMER